MDFEFFTDTMAWAIGIVVWVMFMLMIWKFGAMFGSEWKFLHKIIITVIGLPLCYIVAKAMIDRGG